MNAPVLFDILPTDSGLNIGLAVINTPQSLNALSLPVIQLLRQKLSEWADDARVAAVVLRGAGEKAFCAGGDIRQLYNCMKQASDFPQPGALAFFSLEYGLYHQMHTYAKPIIVWASGIVMGGGAGLTAAASHRVVTPTTRLAMPEITIGLYPDAGASWFLQRMPAKSGLFLGLTGAQCNGRDAIDLNLGECAMPADALPELLDALQCAPWQPAPADNHRVAAQVLLQLHRPDVLPDAQVLPRLDAMHDIVCQPDIYAADRVLRETDFDDAWLHQAACNYRAGCPVTAAVTWSAFHRARRYSVAQALHMELTVSLHCCYNGDFQEGVRALLIDKDKQPHWRYTLGNLPGGYIESHFDSPFAAGRHPFDDWL